MLTHGRIHLVDLSEIESVEDGLGLIVHASRRVLLHLVLVLVLLEILARIHDDYNFEF